MSIVPSFATHSCCKAVYTHCEDASRGGLARQDSGNGYLPRPCACLVLWQPRGEAAPVGFLTCSRVRRLTVGRNVTQTQTRCELFALTGLPIMLLFKMDNEKCRLLIDLYKEHCSLRDPKQKIYHNSTRRENFAVSFYSSKFYVLQ
jgi:hypothetical protein